MTDPRRLRKARNVYIPEQQVSEHIVTSKLMKDRRRDREMDDGWIKRLIG